MKFKLVETILLETIAAVRQNYPKISDDKFNELIRLDPTFKEEKDSVGIYGKWILNLFNKKLVKNEDLYKIPELLNKFEAKKKWFKNKDIGQFKSLPDLAKAIDEVQVGNLTARQQVRQNQKAKHSVDLGSDAELFYENDDWEVWIPKTYAASCKLGSGSQWCTASTSRDTMYYGYRDIYGGYYYVFINKNDTDDRYQLHLPSEQFMDKFNAPIWDKKDLPVMQLYNELKSDIEANDKKLEPLHYEYAKEYGAVGWVIMTGCRVYALRDYDIRNIKEFRWDNKCDNEWDIADIPDDVDQDDDDFEYYDYVKDEITIFEAAEQLIKEDNIKHIDDLFMKLGMTTAIEDGMASWEAVALASDGYCDTKEEADEVLNYLRDGLLKLGFPENEVYDENELEAVHLTSVEYPDIHFEDWLKER